MREAKVHQAVLIALAVVALIWGFTDGQPTVSSDSIKYISTAENLLKGKGYVDYGGNVVSAAPPLYPLALAAVLSGGVSRDQAVMIVNSLALLAIGLFSWLILTRLGVVGVWRVVGMVTTMLSPLLVPVTQSALSETLFLALALAWGWTVMRVTE